MKKLGKFLKGVFQGGAIESTGLSAVVELIKSFDKKYLIKLLDTDGDGDFDGKDIVNLRWEQIGKIVGIIGIYVILVKFDILRVGQLF